MDDSLTQTDLVSVIIPTYNGSRYILSTISSVLQQTYSPIEIIVVDDGSPERIEDLLAPVMGQIRYYRQENKGPASARNFGLRMSYGEFIALLDHDDIWDPGNLRNKVEILKRNPGCAMGYSYPELIDRDGKPIPQEYPSKFPSGSVFEDFLIRNWITTFSCTIIRRSILETVGFLDERREILCCDDYDEWLRIADVSQIVFSPDKSVHYRIHPENLLKNFDISLNSTINVFEKAIKDCKSVASIPKEKLGQIVSDYRYNKYRNYAYSYYYDNKNYRKTRELLLHCVSLKPLIIKNWIYLLVCSLPSVLIDRLRGAKGLVQRTS